VTGQKIASLKTNGADAMSETAVSSTLIERFTKLEQRVAELETSPAQEVEDRLALVMFSGDLDKAIAAFIIATGAAAIGLEVSMFFTFWGINIVKRQRRYEAKNILEKGFTALMPGSSKELPLSQMNYFGLGSKLIRQVMKDNNVTSLEELIALAQEFDIRLVACSMSQELLGISDQELIDGLDQGDVATFLGDASRAKAPLFI